MKKSFLAWMGGKNHLTSTIIPLIPQHHTYAEVFAGAGWVMFRKPEEDSKVEILNDVNADLVTLYRVVKNHLEEFIKHFKWLLIARDEFHRFMLEEPRSLTDVQRAVRFYYLVRCGYGARLQSPSFSIGTARPSNLNLLRIEEDLSAAHLRLSRVYVENLDYQKFIPRFDRAETFFYVDPPYWGCENYYGKGIFNRDDFQTLRNLLGEAQAKWMLSINDVPEIRELFKDFNIMEVDTRYSVNLESDKNRKGGVKELLVMNY